MGTVATLLVAIGLRVGINCKISAITLDSHGNFLFGRVSNSSYDKEAARGKFGPEAIHSVCYYIFTHPAFHMCTQHYGSFSKNEGSLADEINKLSFGSHLSLPSRAIPSSQM